MDKKQDYQLLEETKKLRTAKSTLYVSKKDRWEDASSTAYIFSLFGIIGDILELYHFHLPVHYYPRFLC